MQTITIKNPEVKISKDIFNTYEELFFETKTKKNFEDEADGVLYKMDYEELTEEQKKKVNFLKNTDLEELNLVNF